jgi:hypothetical protein
MDDLLKEAIADAKAVRETALANAKMALEEAFTPRLKSMLAKKIQSEIEDEDEVSDEDEDAVEEQELEDEDDVVDPANSEEGGPVSEEEHEDEDDDEETVSEEEHEDEVEEDDVDLEEVLKALSEVEDEDEEEDVEEIATLKKEVKEHRDVVKYLRSKLNEVNLLNAKLLFSNKLFRAFGLSNEQKMKVVETFDRTRSIREIKLVYSTLAESFKGARGTVKESKGSSSKAVASTKPTKKVITEADDIKARFKKLANII